MIAKGMPVQIRRSGTSILVEQLEIGDLVYDPIADNYNEIVDILSRTTMRLSHALTRVPAGRFGPGWRRQDLLLSRQQLVGWPDRSQASAPVRLEYEAACRLGEEHRVSTLLFALFSERPGCVSVGGILLRIFDPSRLCISGTVWPSGMKMNFPIAASLPRKSPDAGVATKGHDK